MAWSESRMFDHALLDPMGNNTAMDLDSASDVPKNALYNNTGTPDGTVAAASTAYNTGQWVTANEVSQVGQWAAGGVALTSGAQSLPAGHTWMYDSNDTASGSAATLANVYGCLIYDDTLTTPVADQGLWYLYFGGVQSVTGGTFTVVYHANGHVRAAL